MAKNTGRSNKGFRKNSVPNVVDQDIKTAQTNLTNAGFNSSYTTENTSDQNLNQKIKSQDVPAGTVTQVGTNVNLVEYTFSFTPFGAFGFTPFGASGFTPFGAFGFTPFGAFGFTPFGAFGFTPFGAFGFTPFSFAPEFNFSPPSCIEANTLIATPNGDVKACDLRLGDTIYSYKFIEIPESGSSGYEDFDYVNYMTPNLTATEKVETTIVDIIPSSKNVVICFNEDTTRLYSTSQPMFVKRLSLFEILPAGVIEEGDSLIEIGDDLSVNEIFITSINYISGDHSVYQFSCEPQDWFIAGKYLVHNK